jgi:hypothetical protein
MIEINTNKCKEKGLSEGEYLFLFCLLNPSHSSDVDVQLLLELGYIDEHGITVEGAKIVLNETPFDTIYDLFPYKGGDRVLKAKSHTSADYEYCYKKYKLYYKYSPIVNENIIKGLNNEISMRTKGNSLQFMQDIKTWFNQRGWEKYMDYEVEEIQDKVERI